MRAIKPKEACALCSQIVEIKGFSLIGPEGVQKFCCGGCLSIYQLLGNIRPAETSLNLSNNNEDKHK